MIYAAAGQKQHINALKMVGKDLPNGQTKVGDKIVNDVKLTNLPAGRFDGQLRPYSHADVERLR